MAGLIPQSFIEELLARVDIVDVVDSYVPLKKAGRNHQACCPFHNEKTPSFTVSQQKQFYHCFGCGANGTAISFLMEYSGLSFPEAIEELANQYGMTVPREAGLNETERHSAEDYELLEMIVRYYTEQLKKSQAAIEYLKQRGLSGELAKRFEIGYAPAGWDKLLNEFGHSDAARQRLDRIGMIIKKDQRGYYDRFRERIMFPIRDQRGRALGFGGRVLGDDKPKYLNSPETPVFHKGRELYGLYQAKKADRQLSRLYVVEGYMDVLALAQFGVNNAVATLGTAATDDHLERMFKQCSELVFCFDGDEAGRKAAWRALETALPLMRDGRHCNFMFMPDGEDPDSFIRQHGQEGFSHNEQIEPLSGVMFSHLKSQQDMNSAEGRAAFIDAIMTYIKQLPQGALKELLVSQVANETGFDNRALQEQAHSVQPKTASQRLARRPVTSNRQSLPPVRKLIRLLLHTPELAMRENSMEELQSVSLHGVPFLLELIDYIQQRSKTSTADILEHWRDTPYEKHLYALMNSEELLEDEDLLQTEYQNLLNKLIEEDRRQKRRQQSENIKSLDDLKALHGKGKNTPES